MVPMRDSVEIQQRAMDAKQALLMALRHTNVAALDGTQDETDLAELAIAIDQVRNAKDLIERLHSRVNFFIQLERVRAGTIGDESSRWMIGLVRMGVDSGYAIEDVRAMIDAVAPKKPQ